MNASREVKNGKAFRTTERSKNLHYFSLTNGRDHWEGGGIGGMELNHRERRLVEVRVSSYTSGNKEVHTYMEQQLACRCIAERPQPKAMPSITVSTAIMRMYALRQ